MNLVKMLFILTVLVSCNQHKTKASVNEIEIGQEKAETATIDSSAIGEIEAFLPGGFKITTSEGVPNSVKSDLNNDGVFDYVVLMARSITSDDYATAEDVRLTIFEGQVAGSYQLKSQTGNLNVFTQTTLNVSDDTVISLFHQSMRHDYELKFRFKPNYEDYMLIGSEYTNYASGKGTGAGSTSINFLAGKRITIIDGKKKVTNTPEELYAISEIDDVSIWGIITEIDSTAEKKAAQVKETSRYTFDNFQITENRVGMFARGITINDVYNILPKEQIKRTKGVGEFAEDIFDVFKIYDANGKLIVTLTPELYGDDNSEVRLASIEDERFETAEGIGLNSTFGDLDAAYTIDELAPDLEHIIVIIKSLNASFAISKTELKEGWYVTGEGIDKSKIPASAKFDGVTIFLR